MSTQKIPLHLLPFYLFASTAGGGLVGASGHSLHALMYGIGGEPGAPRLLGRLLAAHSHLERLMHESVKREDDPIDEVCCDKSLIFFSFFFFSSVIGLNSA